MRISPSQSWNTSLEVFPQGCMWTVCTALWWVLSCPATSRKTSNQHSCQLHSARWLRIFSFSFKLTQQRWHAPTNSTWPTQNSVFTLGWLWLAALPEISYSCFSRDLGEQYQSSLIWDTDLAVTKQLVYSVHRSTLLPPALENPSPGTRDTWCKTPCHWLESHFTFAERLKARFTEDVIHYPEGFADTLPGADWQGQLRQMLATSPSRSIAEWWLSRRGEEVWIKSSKWEHGVLVKSDSFLIISLSTLNVANYTRGCDNSCCRNCSMKAGQWTFYC